MSKYLLIVIFMSFFFRLNAQSIDLKLRRLEYLQGLIENKRQQAENTREEIDCLSRDKNKFEQQYHATREKIDVLTYREREITKSLIESQQKADMSRLRLEEKGELWQKQIYLFYVAHQTPNNTREHIIDRQYLPLMIAQTRERIDEDKDLLALILKNMQEGQESQQRLLRQKNRENQVVSSYRNEIDQLDESIELLLSKEQEIYEQFIDLQQSRMALERIINYYQEEKDSKQYSYQFTRNKLLWPVEGRIINMFGEVHDKYHNITLLNNGIDILTDRPQDVRAVDFGVVVFAEQFRSYGKLVILDHHNGYFSLYANNSSLLVTKDEVVTLGQVIAVSGRTNLADGYVLHFELRRHNTPVDPLVYLE